MNTVVYASCAVTSLWCCYLLYMKYLSSRHRLLLWSALCFLFLALSNVTLFADLVIFPDLDLLFIRTSLVLVGVSVLVYGLIWET